MSKATSATVEKIKTDAIKASGTDDRALRVYPKMGALYDAYDNIASRRTPAPPGAPRT